MKYFLPLLMIALFIPATFAQDSAKYTCPMHPHYISDQAGSCPICGMDLVPMDQSPSDASGSGISVAPEMIQTMGIRTAPVQVRNFGRSVRAFGHVTANTRLESSVAARLEGWIETLAITAEGDSVKKGDLLFTIYSPNLISAQRDFLSALRAGAAGRIASAERRLKSLGMQASVISSLKKTRAVINQMPVYAEADGLVAVLSVREGDYIKPGADIMSIQNYAQIWVIASVPESELTQLDKSVPVKLAFPDAQIESISGDIDYIYPTIDTKTRTGRVRIIVDNINGALRPGAYADVTFMLEARERLSIPIEAVLRDSRGSHVVVADGSGSFAPRSVSLGITSQDRIEVLGGLSERENIVVSGQFLLDSESSLREGFRKLSPPMPMAAVTADTPLSQLPVNAEALALIDHFVDAALYFHEALVDGYRIDPYFLDPILKAGQLAEQQFEGSKLTPILRQAATEVTAAKTATTSADLAPILNDLITTLEPWLFEGAPVHYRDLGLSVWRENTSGRLWIQEGATVNNPYSTAPASSIAWPDPMKRPSNSPSGVPAEPNAPTGHNH